MLTVAPPARVAAAPRASYRRTMARRERDDDLARRLAELDEVRPFLDLAKEINHHVQQATTDGTYDAATLVDALRAVPDRERQQLVTTVFAQLDADRQWELLAAAYGDAEVRTYLESQRQVHLESLHASTAARAVADRWRTDQRVTLGDLPSAVVLTLGLFRPEDAGAALARGHRSSVCARQLTLRATEQPSVLRVIADVYNPQRGLFVTASYDEQAWRRERLESHSLVRLGSPGASPTAPFEPVLYPGARVDVERDDRVEVGRLHLGFAVVGDLDIFAATA